MSSERIEGTVTLDGLIEGRLPAVPHIEEKLREWTGFTKSLGLRFDMDVSGSSFSVLPGSEAVATSKLGAAPEQVISQTLQQLLDLFPQESRQGIFSTLRSAEVRKGEEVQAIYPVGANGTIQTQTRRVAATTIAQAAPLPAKQKLMLAGLGLLGAVGLVAVLSLFVDFRAIIRDIADTARPLNAEEIRIDASIYEAFFRIDRVEVTPNQRFLLLTANRTNGYPTSEEALSRLWKGHDAGNLPTRLTIEALAKGYVRCEVFDSNNHFVTSHWLRVQDLRQSESVELLLPLPEKRIIGKLVLTY